MSALWQQWRDEAAWVNTSSESELNRAHNTAIAALASTFALAILTQSKLPLPSLLRSWLALPSVLGNVSV